MFDILSIKDQDKSDVVIGLLDHIRVRDERISVLESELARLKKLPSKPKLKPSNISQKDKSISRKESFNKKKESLESKHLKIDKTITLEPDNLPPDAKFHSSREYIVQDIKIIVVNTKYIRKIYHTSEGRYIYAPLPNQVKCHYGSEIKRYILYQHYAMHVPQNAILKYLKEINVKISAGTVNDILTKNHAVFHEEKEALLQSGIKNSSYVTVDDTGHRHNGKNGYCTHIGNQLFAYFKSTASKSRINFLSILNQNKEVYRVNGYMINYLQQCKFPRDKTTLLKNAQGREFSNKNLWESFLKNCSITGKNHIRTAIEAGLIGNIAQTGFMSNISIVSDEAGQFKVFKHGLCWIHTERKINSLTPESDLQAKEQKKIIDQIWKFYKLLKSYKKHHSLHKRKRIKNIFDSLFTQKTQWSDLNKALCAIHKNEKELLLVLERPEIPLHTNQSENDIREIVKKRKISAGTRSDNGRKCRDTFASLSKTCLKLEISFWKYLLDRINGENTIKPLSQAIAQMAYNTS